MSGGHEHPPDEAEVGGKLDFTEGFDVYLKLLQDQPEDKKIPNEKPSDGAKDPVMEVNSRLIPYQALLARAKNYDCALQNLPLSELGSSTARTSFALRHPSVTEISSSMTIQEYAKRDPEAVVKRGETQALTVYSVRRAHVDLKDALSKVEEPSKSIDKKADREFERAYKIPEYQSALETQTSIPMDRISKSSNPLNLEEGDWQKVIRGNELLCGFSVDTKEVSRLRESKMSEYLPSTLQYSWSDPKPTTLKANLTKVAGPNEGEGSNAEGSNTNESGKKGDGTKSTETPNTQQGITKVGLSDPFSPVSRATRPVFVLYVEASSRQNGSSDVESALLSPGSFWSHAKSVATTNILKLTDSLSQWSVNSGMSSKTVGVGLSVPLGDVATLGAKFGFTRETSHKQTFETETDETYYTVTHDVPTALININETTVQLSNDAENDIRKLRKERNFSDLLSFFDKYGTVVFQNVTLGGRLYHTQSLAQQGQKSDFQNEESLKKSANASLGIPDTVELGVQYSSENTNFQNRGEQSFNAVEYLSWNGVGGNPSLSVDPPKWRESLSDYTTWKPIQYDNPVRLDELIGRIAGFSDVPLLFATILASGVLNPSVLTLPPEGLSSQDKRDFETPYLGMGVLGRTGAYAEGTGQSAAQNVQWSDLAPAGFSWNVFGSNRDIKREILANLQSSFNIAANLPYVPLFLQDLVADNKTFTVMFRWISTTRKATWDPDEKTKALDKVSRDDQGNKDEVLSGNCYLGTLTYRAWMIGIWRVRRDDMSSTDFEALRLEVSKFFRKPRLLEESCDWVNSLAERALGPDVSFQLHASDGLRGKEVVARRWTDSMHAFDAVDRRLRMSSLHFLPVSGEVETYPTKDGKDIPVTPPMSESDLMQLQEASAVITFIKPKLERLIDAVPKKPVEATKKEKPESNKNKSLADALGEMKKRIGKLEQDLGNDREEYLFGKKTFSTKILPELDDIEAKVLGLEKNWKQEDWT